MHYCASTHQTSLESKSRLNQEHKAQGKEARAFFGVHQKRSKSVRERLDGPFLKERERRDGPSVQRRRREIGVGFAARTASLRLRPVFFLKKNLRARLFPRGFLARRTPVLDAHALFPACFPDVRLTGFIR
jgi:hypothetical protein